MSIEGKLAIVQLWVWSDELINGFGELADYHKHEAKVIVQINHSRMRTPAGIFADIVGCLDMLIPSSKGLKEISAGALTLAELTSLQNASRRYAPWHFVLVFGLYKNKKASNNLRPPYFYCKYSFSNSK